MIDMTQESSYTKTMDKADKFSKMLSESAQMNAVKAKMFDKSVEMAKAKAQAAQVEQQLNMVADASAKQGYLAGAQHGQTIGEQKGLSKAFLAASMR